jgi:predicted permease
MVATLSIFTSCFAAMMRIFLVSAVGAFAAKFPRNNREFMDINFVTYTNINIILALLTLPAIKYISRLSTFVLVPCLIINALGSALSVALLTKMGLLIPFCLFINLLSYGIGYCFKFVHEKNEPLFQASLVAVGSPNSISLPIMVMQALCEDSTVNEAYNGDSELCNEEAYSMMFIYSIGWNLLYWGYGYQVLINASNASVDSITSQSTPSALSNVISFFTDSQTRKSFAIKFVAWLKGVLSSPVMAAIYTGVFIGLIPPLQRMLFEEISVLRPLGGAISTLAEPSVAINCLVMASSLAHADINIAELKSSTRHVATKLHSASRSVVSRFVGGGGGGDIYDDLSAAEQVEDTCTAAAGVQMSPLHGVEGMRSENSCCENSSTEPLHDESTGQLGQTRPHSSSVASDNASRSSYGSVTGGAYTRDRAWSASDWSPDCEVISAAVDEAWGVGGVSGGEGEGNEREDRGGNVLEQGVHVPISDKDPDMDMDTSCGLEEVRRGFEGEDCGGLGEQQGSESEDGVRGKRSASLQLVQQEHESEGTGTEAKAALPQMRSVLFVILCRLVCLRCCMQ